MAITNADGSIILSTKIDTKGLQEAMAKMRQQAKGTGSAFESLSNAIKVQETRLASLRQQYASYVIRNEQGSAAAKKLSKDIKALSGSLAQNQQRLVAASASAVSFGAKAKTAIAGVGTSLKVIASYLIGIQTIFAAINFSKSGAEFATQTEASVHRLVDIYGSASDSVGNFIDANARALGMSKAAAASFSSVYGNLFSAFADQETNAALTNRYLQMTAVVASKTGRTVEDVQERVRSGLLGNTEAIEDLGIFVNVKTIEMTDAFQRMAGGRSWEQLDAYTQQQIRSMAILEQATAKYGDEVAETSTTIRSRFNAAYQDFQNSWGNVVNTVLLPTLEVLTQVFDIATKGLNAISGISGNILENVQIESESTEQTAENIGDQVEEQKKLNAEIKKSVAGFDEIQILSSQKADSENDGLDAGLQGIGGYFGNEIDGSNYVSEISETMGAIMGIVSLALIAVGLILLFTGASVPYGIGFIIAGAGTLGVTMAAMSTTDVGKDVIQMLLTIMGVASGALLAIGIILCYLSGPSPTTIGMIVAGGALLVGTVGALIGLNPNDIATWLSVITAIAGGAMLALGIILCFVGVIPTGVGLIVAGAVSLASAIALNFDAIWDAITGVFNAIMDWIKAYGLLVIGILLCLTGSGIPLGIALLIKWAKDGAENGVPLAETIVEKVKSTWNAVKSFWNANIAPIFTVYWWLALGKNCINGLITGFEGGINGIINAFEAMINFIVDGLNKISFDVPDWVPFVGGNKWGVNIPRVDFADVQIPRLAKGAVIPPNREFLAVLGDQKHGTNIEAPLSTIQEAVQMVVNGQMEEMAELLASSIEVQREILEAVLGIEIGDDVIGNAVSRYQRKMTVIHGG